MNRKQLIDVENFDELKLFVKQVSEDNVNCHNTIKMFKKHQAANIDSIVNLKHGFKFIGCYLVFEMLFNYFKN